MVIELDAPIVCIDDLGNLGLRAIAVGRGLRRRRHHPGADTTPAAPLLDDQVAVPSRAALDDGADPSRHSVVPESYLSRA